MKKTLITLLSVSLTAGTTYWAYGKIKAYTIKKLFKDWKTEAGKKQVSLDETTLTKELEKLYLWDVLLLKAYTDKVMNVAPAEQRSSLLKKIDNRKIRQTANLKSLDGILFSI